MTNYQLEIATEIIRASSRGKAADAALRENLKRASGLTPTDAAEISRVIFAFYRWNGWLAKSDSLERQFSYALELDAQFQDAPDRFSTEALRAKAVPGWVWDEVERNDAWLRALQAVPQLWLRARRGQGTALGERLSNADLGRLPDSLVYWGQEDLFCTEEFKHGEFEIQDIASQAVGILCAAEPGETWWDACAGEGGKLLHLSDLMENKGLIWASDRAEWRLKKLKQRAARAGVFNYRAVLWNGSAKLPTKTKFDGVLVDAPCSGVGTWQRNPHARWTTTPEDVKELSEIQKNLVSHLAPSVKRGGKLIYSVCTLTRSETSNVAGHFSATQPEFERLPLRLKLTDETILESAASLSIWPKDFGGNGMFVAAWQRKG